MVMQLSTSVGVTLAGLLLGTFAAQQSQPELMQQAFISTWICMAAVIVLPALVFRHVPPDVTKNVVLSRRRKP
jgi:DHA2 family multidrug resistance protein-like MFS transporter